jgi:hypothetical protein
MSENYVSFGAWASVKDDCPMRFTSNGADGVDMVMGAAADMFEMCFTLPALERFLDLAGEALTVAKEEAVEDEKRKEARWESVSCRKAT